MKDEVIAIRRQFYIKQLDAYDERFDRLKVITEYLVHEAHEGESQIHNTMVLRAVNFLDDEIREIEDEQKRITNELTRVEEQLGGQK